jgi:uncharacterized OB-fold protein
MGEKSSSDPAGVDPGPKLNQDDVEHLRVGFAEAVDRRIWFWNRLGNAAFIGLVLSGCCCPWGLLVDQLFQPWTLSLFTQLSMAAACIFAGLGGLIWFRLLRLGEPWKRDRLRLGRCLACGHELAGQPTDQPCLACQADHPVRWLALLRQEGDKDPAIAQSLSVSEKMARAIAPTPFIDRLSNVTTLGWYLLVAAFIAWSAYQGPPGMGGTNAFIAHNIFIFMCVPTLSLLPMGMKWLHQQRVRRRLAQGRCGRCNYNLRQTPVEADCPECGCPHTQRWIDAADRALAEPYRR